MAFIPSPIIYNILSKLPVKSLARFKSLNKLYCSFINDPHFINAHFKNHSVVHGDLCLILSCIEHQNLNNTTKIHFFTIKDNEHAMIEYSMPDKYKLYLVELKGELCMVDLDFEDKKRVDIWIFKSNEEHWVKLGTIVHRSEPIDTTCPVGIKANKKEILLHGFIKGLGHLSCYNMET
ncbi:hypothetical protein Golax_022679, partial [Gossypium laxum]|nr:hypothetical protein [Gossypium laxum]